MTETAVIDVADVLQCGLDVPADGMDACVHSSVVRLCCVCAGCVNHIWWCGRLVAVQDPLRDPKMWARYLGLAFLLGLALSGVLTKVFWGLFLFCFLGCVGLFLGADALLHAIA
jgi:hypothetical protein